MLSPLGPAEQLGGGSRAISASSLLMRLALALKEEPLMTSQAARTLQMRQSCSAVGGASSSGDLGGTHGLHKLLQGPSLAENTGKYDYELTEGRRHVYAPCCRSCRSCECRTLCMLRLRHACAEPPMWGSGRRGDRSQLTQMVCATEQQGYDWAVGYCTAEGIGFCQTHRTSTTSFTAHGWYT